MYAHVLPGSNQVSMYTIDNNSCDIVNIGLITNILYQSGAKVWLNLTNGLEAVSILDNLDVPYDFCRFRSTAFEQKMWGDALDSMPDDMLVRLALGQRQVIIDFGAKRYCSRAMRQGIPIVARMLSQAWGIDVDEHMWTFSRTGLPMRCDDDFAREAMHLNKKQISRLKYFSKYVSDNTKAIKIAIICAPTYHDNDYDYYVKQIMESSTV